MAYRDGIKLCNEIIVTLVSGQKLQTRVEEAFDKLKNIGIMDTSIEYFREVVNWCDDYNMAIKYDIKLDGASEKKYEKESVELTNLSISVAKLCVKIIQYNSAEA